MTGASRTIGKSQQDWGAVMLHIAHPTLGCGPRRALIQRRLEVRFLNSDSVRL